MAYKKISIRMDQEGYDFVKRLAEEEKEDISTAVRDLIDRGRVNFAVEQYKKGNASLGRASRIAGVSVSEMIDLLSEYGVKSTLEEEDYLSGLKNLEAIY